MAFLSIFVTDKKKEQEIEFPCAPERINFGNSTRFASYDVLDYGEVKIPSGLNIGTYNWDGILPGEARVGSPWVSSNWTDPEEIQRILSRWRTRGTKLRLMIPGTPINHDVYLEEYNMEYSGGFGDYTYSIRFIDAYNLEISSVTVKAAPSAPAETKRPAPATKTYTVVKGDCLWSIAQRFMGAGSKYPELYAANKAVIDGRNKGTGNPTYTIYAGTKLVIPSTGSGSSSSSSSTNGKGKGSGSGNLSGGSSGGKGQGSGGGNVAGSH